MNFKITKREIIFSIIILAVLLFCGMLITGAIRDGVDENNTAVYRMTQLETIEAFDFGLETNIGKSIVIANIEAIDPVAMSGLDGKYMTIEKVYETEEYKSRTVTYTDDDGNTKTKTEHYWEWEVSKREFTRSNTVKFNGHEIKLEAVEHQFTTNHGSKIKTSAHKRHYYITRKVKYSGAATVDLTDGSIEKISFREGFTVPELFNSKIHSATGWIILFWIAWVFVIAGAIYLFYYFDNKWIEG